MNDVHSQLNESTVAELALPSSVADVQDVVRRAADGGLPVAVSGGRHAMGGQQFCHGGVLLDMRPLARVLELDRERGVIEVEAGIQWPALLEALHETEWAFRQKQTGADRLTIGGALAANAHGRGLVFPPIVSDVESFTVVGPDGELRTCSRDENPELFGLVIGGYGLFGVVYSVTLRLEPRRVLERVVEVRSIEGLIDAFDERIRDGFLYGDFQFAIDPSSDDFLRRGIFSCYRPIAGMPEIPGGQRALSLDDWKRLLALAHEDKAQAWERYSAHYLATSGQLYESDAHQFAEYVDDYHLWLDELAGTGPATEMITEIYVPRERLVDFAAEVAEDFRATDVDVIYGTIRLIERDDDSFLAWAREPWACTIFNLHVAHTREAIERAADAFRRLIDMGVARGGSYFLTYHRWARRDQVEACYPQFADFLAEKHRHDPGGRFQSDWYRHHLELLR